MWTEKMWDSKKASRVIAGRRAQGTGASFENSFQAACAHHGIIATRIPDGCKQLSGKRLIRVKTPFDWVLSYKGTTILVDTKTCDTTAFANSLIEPHQALSMVRHDMEGTKAGYLIWLRKCDQVIYIPARHLCQAMQERGSISPDSSHAVNLGSFTTMNLKALFIAEATALATIAE